MTNVTGGLRADLGVHAFAAPRPLGPAGPGAKTTGHLMFVDLAPSILHLA
jgi:hypothetical protein